MLAVRRLGLEPAWEHTARIRNLEFARFLQPKKPEPTGREECTKTVGGVKWEIVIQSLRHLCTCPLHHAHTSFLQSRQRKRRPFTSSPHVLS